MYGYQCTDYNYCKSDSGGNDYPGRPNFFLCRRFRYFNRFSRRKLFVVNRRNHTINYSFHFGFVYSNSNNRWLQCNECTNYGNGEYYPVTANYYTRWANNFLFGRFGNIDFFYRRILFVVNRRNNSSN